MTQHDCDKCKETEKIMGVVDQLFSDAVDANDRPLINSIKELDGKLKLLEFLSERITTMQEFVVSDTFGPTVKLTTLEAILGACVRHIKQAQQS